MDKLRPVYLDSDKCNGCVNCMKKCPTEAIRVRNGKATITYERCIGCGECVRACPSKAKKEYYDSLDDVKKFAYTIAVPTPALYGQFGNLQSTDYVVSALKNLGFSDVVEGALGAEYVSAATAEYIKSNHGVHKPIISSACPAVVELIQMRYEHLLDNLSPMQQPEEVAANIARAKAQMETGLPDDQIGVFVIASCAAKVTSLKNSKNAKIDGVLAVKELYFPLINELNKLNPESLYNFTMRAGSLGVSWGASTGEAVGLGTDNYVFADGVENVINVLSDLEHDRLIGIDFVELNACMLGCVGGSMNMESPFLARTRLRKIRKGMEERTVDVDDFSAYRRVEPYKCRNVFKLDDNILVAMRKTLQMQNICATLPGINCGSCGAPSCKAFAEDVVRGIKTKCRYVEASYDGNADSE